jgi:hypothetical protein
MKHTAKCNKFFITSRQEVINTSKNRIECDSCSASRKLTTFEKEVNFINGSEYEYTAVPRNTKITCVFSGTDEMPAEVIVNI